MQSKKKEYNQIYCIFDENADNLSDILEKAFIDYLKDIEKCLAKA